MTEFINLSELINYSLTNKTLSPLTQSDIEIIRFIESINVEGFSEADVRAEIIDPIIRLLGYKHGTYSSVKREKNIQFLGKKNKYIDYAVLLWEENFWLIEAKKPLKSKSFRYSDLSQAIEYSVHPEINSILIVLCDGKKIEIFDREDSLSEPVLHVEVKELLNNFDKLRLLLSPIQSWFFYKRRVLRVIDKAFDKEFNQNRVNEFSELVQNRLQSKRSIILKNFQSKGLLSKDDWNDRSKASIDDIIDIHFFMSQTNPSLDNMTDRLLELSEGKELFNIPYKMYPRQERDYNSNYICHSLLYFIKAAKNQKVFQYLHNYIDNKKIDLTQFIKYLLEVVLTSSRNDQNKKVILLASDTYRRIFKILSIISSQDFNIGKLQHLITRYTFEELSWEQLLSSQNRNIIKNIECLTLDAVYKFTHAYQDKENFKVNLAQLKLKSLWNLELNILQEVRNYHKIERELDIGEIYPTEFCSLTYDYLGHYGLVIIKEYPEWQEYALKTYKSDIEALANLGSWSARQLLNSEIEQITEEEKFDIASKRFFYGNKDLVKKLYAEYTKT